MDQNEELGGILEDLAVLAKENSDVRMGRVTEDAYRAHCDLVFKRIEAAFPSK